MAHTCPICGSYCNCHGDIDDMDLGMAPTHCECCIDEDEDYGEEDDDFEIDDDIEERNDPNDSRNL